jgi:hypothetical protein
VWGQGGAEGDGVCGVLCGAEGNGVWGVGMWGVNCGVWGGETEST